MKYRKLRIGWSVGWGLVAVMLCVLWVRSGQRVETAMARVLFLHFQIDTSPGTCWMGVSTAKRHGRPWGLSSKPQDWTTGYPFDPADLSMWGRFDKLFGRISGRSFASVCVPFWFLIGLTASMTAAPWLHWRFSLRTMLIATTLVAVVLGLIVYAV